MAWTTKLKRSEKDGNRVNPAKTHSSHVMSTAWVLNPQRYLMQSCGTLFLWPDLQNLEQNSSIKRGHRTSCNLVRSCKTYKPLLLEGLFHKPGEQGSANQPWWLPLRPSTAWGSTRQPSRQRGCGAYIGVRGGLHGVQELEFLMRVAQEG